MNTTKNKRTKMMIDVDRVTKSFLTADGPFEALKDVSLKIGKGECVAITGASGSGKSTLLNILTGIDKPTGGDVFIAGVPIGTLSESELAKWRGTHVGVVFQFFQLIPTLTVVENVMLPMDFCNTYSKKERRTRAMDLLNRVGIADQAEKLPSMLSGGQQQRVSIARALANDPEILVADEPTGNLDSSTSDDILNQLAALAEAGKTVVVVTHEREFSKYFNKTITIKDGRVIRTHDNTINQELKYASQI